MKEENRIISILFSDIQGYSKIKKDNLYTKILSFNQKIIHDFLNDDNHIYVNTWGDAFFICSNDPADLAEIALQIRDRFKNTNWIKLGFDQNLSVRIGLHTAKVKLIIDGDIVKDVIGHGITSTARIEPIVEPNQIYCSDVFNKHLLMDEELNYKTIRIGIHKLAKQFGEMELFKLVREYETDSDQLYDKSSKIIKNNLRINKGVTDKQKDDFLYYSFRIIFDYFDRTLKELENENPEIETKFVKVTEEKIKCMIYLSGELKSNCKIWISSEPFSKSILYSENLSFNDNSFNESLSVSHDGNEIYIEALMGMQFGYDSQHKFADPYGAAEYLFKRFIQSLEY